MTFPVVVAPSNGQFAAALVGAPEIRGLGPTQAQAVEALKQQIAQRVARGELLSVEMESGVANLAGKYRDDPTLRELCQEAYQLRQAEAHE